MSANHSSSLELEASPLESQTLDSLLSRPPHSKRGSSNLEVALAAPSTIVGKLVGLTPTGWPLVDFAGNPEGEPLPARNVCVIASADFGRDAVLIFENNDLRRPIVLGLLQPAPSLSESESEDSVDVSLDGEQMILTAKKELVLRCGKASITLTRAGKVLIRGAYLLSRSSGANRIKGGSVQIN